MTGSSVKVLNIGIKTFGSLAIASLCLGMAAPSSAIVPNSFVNVSTDKYEGLDYENDETKNLFNEMGLDQREVEKTQAELVGVKQNLELTEMNLKNAETALRDVESRLTQNESILQDSKTQIEKTEKEIAEGQKDLGEMASTMYKNNGVSNVGIVNYLVEDGGDISDKASAIFMMDKVMEKTHGTIQYQEEQKSLVESEKIRQDYVLEEIGKLKVDAENLKITAQENYKKAESERKDYETKLASAQEAVTDAKQRYDSAVKTAKEEALAFKLHQESLVKKAEAARKAQAEAERLQKIRDAKEVKAQAAAYAKAEAAAKAKAKKSGAAYKPKPKPSAKPSYNSDPKPQSSFFPLYRPAQTTRITSNFGWRPTPSGTIDYGGQGGYVHAGMDYGTGCGAPIRAAADGEVWLAGWSGSSGQAVAISHGVVSGFAFATRYHHMSQISVYSGQKVKRGQILGLSGTTGNSNGCHLHFETLVNGSAVNPVAYLP